MNLDLLLFLFRLISAALLLALLAGILIILWQDYQLRARQIKTARRSHGRLIAVQQIDNTLMTTGQTYPLLPLTTLGRAPTNTVVITDTFASSEHARITLQNGQWWLEDRKSRNGTLLNETLIEQPVIMTSGDVIGIGSQRFQLELE